MSKVFIIIISMFARDLESLDCNFEDINQLLFFFDFVRCPEMVHDNKEFSCENPKPRCESVITTR